MPMPNISNAQIADYLRRYNISPNEQQLGQLSEIAQRYAPAGPGVGGFSGNGAGGFAGSSPMDALTGGGPLGEGGSVSMPPPAPSMPSGPEEMMGGPPGGGIAGPGGPPPGGRSQLDVGQLNAQMPPPGSEPNALSQMYSPQRPGGQDYDQSQNKYTPNPALRGPGAEQELDPATAEMRRTMKRMYDLGQGNTVQNKLPPSGQVDGWQGTAPGVSGGGEMYDPFKARQMRRRGAY